MGIAMLTVSSLMAPLQGLLSWFMPATPAQQASAQRPVAPCSRAALRPVVHAAKPQAARTCAPKPLRVFRVIDAGAPSGAGRMVISGRMADVCAELDRLAALEAARH